MYNSLNEAVSDRVGTNDTPTSGEWSPSNNTGTANMVEVRSYQYDNGGVGDGNLTQETDYPGLGAPNRVTDFWYDWRDRLVAQKSGVESDGKKESGLDPRELPSVSPQQSSIRVSLQGHNLN